MWSSRYFRYWDFRVIPILFCLMLVSLAIISAHTGRSLDPGEEVFFTPIVKAQLQWFGIGSFLYIVCAGFDYNKLREWTWILYLLMLALLVGLFFTDAIQRVNRWYRIPLLNMSLQPSEYAKLIVVITLSWFLERQKGSTYTWETVWSIGCIVGIPFFLILKQPDLGTALVLYPITLVMGYFGNLRPSVVRAMTWAGGIALCTVAVLFLGIVPHETMRPYATKVLKEYQFERLNPATHHQKTAVIAIAVGGAAGTGWKKSEFSGRGWLPAAYTDSVFPAFGEEFGFAGLVFLLSLYYTLIYCSFQVTAVAKDSFGRLLSAGVTAYLSIHVIINVGMMTGFLPITGVPLILVSYGGSSILSTMIGLGLLQSIYSRRFMF